MLRRWDSGESDRRIALLTPDRGKIYVTARGARKAGARLSGSTEPGTYANFAIAARRNAYVTQVQQIRSFAELRSDYKRLMCALTLLETADAVAPEDQSVPEVFETCLAGIVAIEANENPLAALCWIDLKLMSAIGVAPDFGGAMRASALRLSPEDGGAATGSSRDSFEASREVVVALAKLQELAEPPPKLKKASDVAACLARFWEVYAGKKLSARQALLVG